MKVERRRAARARTRLHRRGRQGGGPGRRARRLRRCAARALARCSPPTSASALEPHVIRTPRRRAPDHGAAGGGGSGSPRGIGDPRCAPARCRSAWSSSSRRRAIASSRCGPAATGRLRAGAVARGRRGTIDSGSCYRRDRDARHALRMPARLCERNAARASSRTTSRRSQRSSPDSAARRHRCAMRRRGARATRRCSSWRGARSPCSATELSIARERLARARRRVRPHRARLRGLTQAARAGRGGGDVRAHRTATSRTRMPASRDHSTSTGGRSRDCRSWSASFTASRAAARLRRSSRRMSARGFSLSFIGIYAVGRAAWRRSRASWAGPSPASRGRRAPCPCSSGSAQPCRSSSASPGPRRSCFARRSRRTAGPRSRLVRTQPSLRHAPKHVEVGDLEACRRPASRP